MVLAGEAAGVDRGDLLYCCGCCGRAVAPGLPDCPCGGRCAMAGLPGRPAERCGAAGLSLRASAGEPRLAALGEPARCDVRVFWAGAGAREGAGEALRCRFAAEALPAAEAVATALALSRAASAAAAAAFFSAAAAA